jgi:hypothetical protein
VDMSCLGGISNSLWYLNMFDAIQRKWEIPEFKFQVPVYFRVQIKSRWVDFPRKAFFSPTGDNQFQDIVIRRVYFFVPDYPNQPSGWDNQLTKILMLKFNVRVSEG